MATSRDWSQMKWDPTQSFALPTEFQLARTGMADAGMGSEYKFAASPQNAELLAALGFGGNAFTNYPGSEEMPMGGPVWSDDARNWLASNGYNLGVAHDPGTTPGGRAEYFGLTGPDGQFVNGQSDPTMTQSDTLMDQIAMFAAFLAPTIGGIAAAGGGVGAGAGVAGGLGAEAGAGIGTLGAAESGVTALGSAWSPQALGLSGGAAGGLSAAELASLGAALPGAVEVGAGLGAAAGAGGLAGGGGAAGGVTATLPTQVITGTSAGAGAGGAGSGGLLGGGAAAGGSALSGLSSADKAALYGAEGYGPGMSGAQTSVYDGLLNTTGSKTIADLAANSGIGSSIVNGVDTISKLVGGGSNLAGLIGAGLGAASGGGTETSSRDPWAAAQPYLKNILGDAETMRANLAANPFTQQQQQAYQNAYSGLDQARAAMPGLLNWGQAAMGRQSTTPSYEQLFGGAQPGGLLQQPQQPTAQAGGPGGLLGSVNDDRIKNLMARGRGLLGQSG